MGAVRVRWADGDAHALLRETVASVVGVALGAIEVGHHCRTCGATDHGRPVVVVAGRAGPHVSLSRSRGRSIVAVADREVGIDLERTGGPESAGELRTWVRTEALLKALGHGLAVDPRLVELSADGPRPGLVGWAGPGRRPAVRLLDLDAGDSWVAAVAQIGRRPVRVDGGAVIG